MVVELDLVRCKLIVENEGIEQILQMEVDITSNILVRGSTNMSNESSIDIGTIARCIKPSYTKRA